MTDHSRNKTETMLPGGMNPGQRTGLLILRLFIGWHFLYEGMIKWTDQEWSAKTFLNSSTWIFSGFFQWLAGDATLLALVDFLNQTGLVIIGVALIAGLFSRPAAVAGMVLLGLYYLSHPPLFEGGMLPPGGDQYLLIDRNLIEMAGLYLLYTFHAGRIAGIDALIKQRRFTR